MHARARGLAAAAASIAAVGLVGATLATLIPVWPCVLLEHFRLQYVWGGALVVLACAGLRMRGWFDIALIATVFHACWVLPDLSRSARPLPATGEPLRMLVLNVHTSSSSYDEVARLVADTKPDVVGLVEIDAAWLGKLAPALAGYPHRIEDPFEGNFGLALYSKLPMTGGVEHLGSPLPTIVARLDVRGVPVAVVLTHPIPPVRREPFALQLSQLAAIAQRTHELAAPAIVMGDLNATPWSRPFRDFIAASGLCDTRAGFGLQASFPAASAVLRIPIDHVLASCSIGVRSREIERDVGSDHLPVVIDLVLPRG